MPANECHDDTLTALASTLMDEAKRHHQRRALVLAGDADWCWQSGRIIQYRLALEAMLWVSDSEATQQGVLAAKKVTTLLGQEFDLIVFDAHSGFDADAFAAILGALRGGGLLLWLTPPMATWPDYADPHKADLAQFPYQPSDVSGHFVRRLTRQFDAVAVAPVVVAQGQPLPKASVTLEKVARPSDHDPVCRTPDQAIAVAAIIKVAKGHRRRPVVLTSDRGRGKSAALGIAAAQLLQQGTRHILVTAPRMDAAAALFAQARRLLPEATLGRGVLHYQDATLRFMAPDALCLAPVNADLLLVDEAAAIPVASLSRLLQRYARIVFATTVHGYEGTGRGFALRFEKTLSERTPGWKAVELTTPIRWAANDPLERFLYDALLLDSAPQSAAQLAAVEVTACRVERLTQGALAENEPRLRALFGLLISAHYRTRPSDLRRLLDSPNVSIYAMFYGEQLVATALLAAEGAMDAQLAQGIFTGQRRLRGHLVPQSLAAHVGLVEAPQMRFARVLRIAVQPALQGQGLGQRMLLHLVEQARQQQFDGIAASFGATPDLLHFWRRGGFKPVYLGVSREHTSGAHACMVLAPLSDAGDNLFKGARTRFLGNFPHLLLESFRDLEPVLVTMLMRSEESVALPLDAQDKRELAAFAFALRGYEVTAGPLWKFVSNAMNEGSDVTLLSLEQRGLLIMKVLQKRSWSEVAAALGLPGRAAAVAALRQAVQCLAKDFV